MDEASLHQLNSPADVKAELVFVHGLDGHYLDTWADEGNGFWPLGIAEDVPGVRVWSLQYDAAPAIWVGSPMPLEERAKNTLERLSMMLAGETPIVIVAHSLGGVLTTAMMVRGFSQRDQKQWQKLVERVAAVVFLATPHTGSSLAQVARALLPGAITPAVETLARNHSTLISNLERYRGEVGARKKPRHAVFRENKGVLGVKVVEESAADPGLPGVVPIQVEGDHFGVAKPHDRQSLVYLSICRLLDDILGLPFTPPAARPFPRRPEGPARPQRVEEPDDYGRRQRRGRLKTASYALAGAVAIGLIAHRAWAAMTQFEPEEPEPGYAQVDAGVDTEIHDRPVSPDRRWVTLEYLDEPRAWFRDTVTASDLGPEDTPLRAYVHGDEVVVRRVETATAFRDAAAAHCERAGGRLPTREDYDALVDHMVEVGAVSRVDFRDYECPSVASFAGLTGLFTLPSEITADEDPGGRPIVLHTDCSLSGALQYERARGTAQQPRLDGFGTIITSAGFRCVR